MADTAKRNRAITLGLIYHGAIVSIAFSAEDNVPINEIEQMVDTILRREGWGAQNSAPPPTPRPPAEWVDPEYDNNGDPCCPVHHRPLKQGTYGSYCSARAAAGESANEKGYCSLKFKE
jgi:hypothetical protein